MLIHKGFNMNNKLLDRKMERWKEKYHDFSPELKKQIDKLVSKFEAKSSLIDCNLNTMQLKATLVGKRFLREYNGKIHEVKALEQGFYYNNKIYKSLSAIAYEITGTRWNGKRFFGVCK